MSRRDKILAAVKDNQPDFRELPALPGSPVPSPEQLAAKFIGVLEAIGGNSYIGSGLDRIAHILREGHADARRIVPGCPGLASLAETTAHYVDPHTLEKVDLAVVLSQFVEGE